MPHTALRRLIRELGSQKAAADALGFTPSFINDVLQGRREMTAALARRLGFKQRLIYEPLKRPEQVTHLARARKIRAK